MIYSLIFTVTGNIDQVTVVNLPIPPADDATGVFQFAIAGNMGVIDPVMLHPLVGPGGYLLCGVGMNIIAAGADVFAGMRGRTAGSVGQMFPPLDPLPVSAGLQPPYLERPCYVPPFYQLYFGASSEDPEVSIIRIDIAPLRTVRQAARALRVTRPNLLVPIVFP